MASTSEYMLSGPIGEGSFGVVVHARHKSTGLDVAIKCIDKASLVKGSQQQAVAQVVQEQKLLKRLKQYQQETKHQKQPSDTEHGRQFPPPDESSSSLVVNLYASFHDAACVYIVTDCCTGGTLQDWLTSTSASSSRQTTPIPTTASTTPTGTIMMLQPQHSDDATSFYGGQLVQALWHLHTVAGIVHCDIKPSNILLTAAGRVKVADFGSAYDLRLVRKVLPTPPAPQQKQKQQDAFAKRPRRHPVYRGTTAYSAPELLMLQNKSNANNSQEEEEEDVVVTPAADLWSLACVLFALLHKKIGGESPPSISAGGGAAATTIPASSPFDCQLQEAATVHAIASFCDVECDDSPASFEQRSTMLFGSSSSSRLDENNNSNNNTAAVVEKANITTAAWKDLILRMLHPRATKRLGVRDLSAGTTSSSVSRCGCPHTGSGVAYPSIAASVVWKTPNGCCCCCNTTTSADSSILPQVPNWWQQASSPNTVYKDGSEGWSAFLV